jgi:hypothetical protein
LKIFNAPVLGVLCMLARIFLALAIPDHGAEYGATEQRKRHLFYPNARSINRSRANWNLVSVPNLTCNARPNRGLEIAPYGSSQRCRFLTPMPAGAEGLPQPTLRGSGSATGTHTANAHAVAIRCDDVMIPV